MTQNLLLSLQVTLIGMGLVFCGIIALWGVLAALVRVMRSQPRSEPPEDIAITEHLMRQRAAAAAVAFALAAEEANQGPHEFPLPPTAIVSAWQAVLRSGMLNKRGSIR